MVLRQQPIPHILRKRDDKANPIAVPASQSWDGNDGLWSSFSLQVGHPAQDVRVFPSTAAAETWVVTAAGACPDGIPLPQGTGTDTCFDSRGRLFNENTTVSWVPNSIYSLGVEANLGFDSSASYGYDSITLGMQGSGGPTLQHQIIAELADPHYWIGGFGLNPRPTNFTSFVNPQPSAIQTLKTNKQIPSLSYGYTAGAYYRLNHIFGSLTLGGYDSNLFKQNEIAIPHYSDDSRDIVAGIRDIKSNVSISSLLPGGAITTLVDSTLPFIYLPKDSCQAFEREFGLTYDEDTSLYLLNARQHENLLSQNPAITFTIGSGTSGGATTDITLPYAAFDHNVSYPWIPQDQSSTRYFPLRRADNDTQYTLGRTFLQEAYLTVDYERKTFNLAQRTWAQDQDAHTNLVAIHPHGYSSGLPKGAIAGIAVGAVAALTLIIGLIAFFLLRRRRQKRQQQSGHDSADSPTVSEHHDLKIDPGSPNAPRNPFTTPSPALVDSNNRSTNMSTTTPISSRSDSQRDGTRTDSHRVLSPISPDGGTLGQLGTYVYPRHELPLTTRTLHEEPGVDPAKTNGRYSRRSKQKWAAGYSDRQQQQELQGSGPGAWEADSAALVELPGSEVPLGMSEKLGGARLVGFDGVARKSVERGG